MDCLYLAEDKHLRTISLQIIIEAVKVTIGRQGKRRSKAGQLK